MLKRVVHPGGVLQDELAGLRITAAELARQLDVPPNRLSQIMAGKQAVTGDTALRLGHWFGMDPQFWLSLQSQYDLALADQQAGTAIRRLPVRTATAAG